MRNKQKLENVYHTTAVAAMNFCVNNERKQEFKRIGEMLRTHFAQLSYGGTTQPPTTPINITSTPISLITPTSLNHLFNIRFEYLNAAVKLELWQEAFKTVEDINEIITTIQRQPPAQLLANYYEKLAQLFLVSHNYLYHSYAWLRFYVLSKNQHLSLKEEEVQQIASVVLVSALAIPIEGPTNQFNNRFFELNLHKEKNSRLTSLLGSSNANLTRDSLLKEIYQNGIPSNVLPGPLRDLYNLVEVKFQPLELCKSLEKSFEFIQNNDQLVKYLPLVKKAAFTRQLQALSKVYQTMKLTQIHSLSPFQNPDATEKSIIKAANLKLISARIDHQQQIITFNNLSLLESGSIKSQLTLVYEKLSQAVKLIDPERENVRLEKKCKFLATVDKNMDSEYDENIQRIEEIEGEKEREEYYEKKKARLQQLKQQLEQAKAPKPTEASVSSTPAAIKEKTEKDLQKETQVKQQKELEQKRETLLKQFYKTVISLDYLERARRENEAPLLEKWFEDATQKDRELHEQLSIGSLERAKQTHANELKEKSRLSRVRAVADAYKEQKLFGKREQFEQNLIEAKRKNEEIRQQIAEEIVKIKKERIQRRIEQEAEEKQRKEKAAEEQRKKEAEDAKRRAEEEERAQQESTKKTWGSQNGPSRWSKGTEEPSSGSWKSDPKPSASSDTSNWRKPGGTSDTAPKTRPGWGKSDRVPEPVPVEESPRKPAWGRSTTDDRRTDRAPEPKPSIADKDDNWRARPASTDKPAESPSKWGRGSSSRIESEPRSSWGARGDERRGDQNDRRGDERRTSEDRSLADSDDNWRARPASNDKPATESKWGRGSSARVDTEPKAEEAPRKSWASKNEDRRPDERRQDDRRQDDRRPNDSKREEKPSFGNRNKPRADDEGNWRRGKDQPPRREQPPKKAAEPAEPPAQDEDGFFTVTAVKKAGRR